MPACQTRYFGISEYAEQDAIRFPQGLPGFPAETRFLVLQRPLDYPLVFLQSTLTPDLCFLAIHTRAVDSGYTLSVNKEDALALGTGQQPQMGPEVLCLALVSVRDAGPTANLLAPVVINHSTRTGIQCFNMAGSHSHQHPLLPSGEGVAA